MTPNIVMTDTPDPSMRRAIVMPLVRFNEAQAGQPENYIPLAVLLTDPDNDEIIGGSWGGTMFSHLHVDLLFVPGTLRRGGIGRNLMGMAETEAVRRGCVGAWLDTYSFKAREFYERLGYIEFGTIYGYPPGHSRIFVRKTLP